MSRLRNVQRSAATVLDLAAATRRNAQPRRETQSHALEVTEKIHDVRIVSCKGREDRRPDLRGILAPHRLAIFGLDQLEPHGFYLSTKVQGLNVQRKWRQCQRTASWRSGPRRIHSSDSNCGNFSRKSGACFRTSTQSKKASGVSSQMRNHPAISAFSARF